MFIFPLDPQSLLKDRSRLFEWWGIPRDKIRWVQSTTLENWKSNEGSWEYQWVQQAKVAEYFQDYLLASLCYGAAKFPYVCTVYRQHIFEQQLFCFTKAALDFSFDFERRLLTVPYRGEEVLVATHVYSLDRKKVAPLVILSGGVDTWKMELHRIAIQLMRWGGFRVVVMDMPGTGESPVFLKPDADLLYRGVIDYWKQQPRLSPPCVGIVGISFGGHWALKLALQGEVDACVSIGGPVGVKMPDGMFLTSLPYGMSGILANAMGYEAMPLPGEARQHYANFSLEKQGLFSQPELPPTLVVNGDQDPYVSIDDTLTFQGRKNADVWLVKNTGHCAEKALPRLMPGIIGWLQRQLYEKHPWRQRVLETVGRWMLPTLRPPSG